MGQRRGRRKAKRKPTTFSPIVQRLGGIRRASRALGFDPHYVLMLASGLVVTVGGTAALVAAEIFGQKKVY